MTAHTAHAAPDTLNAQQQKAVGWLNGHSIVLAGAGCGKTAIITQKMAHLLESGMPMEQLLAITFTQKAAKQMRDRLASLLNPRAPEAQALPKIMTFHALGLEILRTHSKAARLRPNFNLMDSADVRGFFNQAAARQRLRTKKELRAAVAAISAYKNDFILPEDARKRAIAAWGAMTANMYAEYENMLATYSAVDFDDLILKPTLLLQNRADIRERWQTQFQHILVDEYQDTNRSQYFFFRLLVGEHGHFTVVGDDDQSIYQWRGAYSENLTQIANDFPNVETIFLEQNYRSTNTFLHAATGVIQKNDRTFAKSLWSELGEGEPIRLMTSRDEMEEVYNLIKYLRFCRHRYRYDWADCCLLYRSNFQALPFEAVLRQQNIPYRISGGVSLFDRAECRDILAFIKLAARPDDDPAFLRVVQNTDFAIDEPTLAGLSRFQKSQSQPAGLLACCHHPALAGALPDDSVKALKAFHAWFEGWVQLLHENMRPALEKLTADIGYEQRLIPMFDRKTEAAAAWQRVETLCRILADMMARAQKRAEEGTEDASLLALLQNLRIEEPGEADGKGLNLMTIHAAKGLEFPCVCLVGVNEGFIPHKKNAVNNLAEERRLFYVAITRAANILCLSTLTHRTYQGKHKEKVARSPFLADIPAELTAPAVMEYSIEEADTLRKTNLAAIRAALQP